MDGDHGMKFDRVSFAAARRKAQQEIIDALVPVVTKAIGRKKESDTWWRAVVDAAKPLFDHIVTGDGGDPAKAAGDWARTALDITHSLTKTKAADEVAVETVATWVAGQILDAATIAAAEQAGEDYEIEWISMHDSKVRHTHKVADGQRIKRGEKFLVGDSRMDYPHDTSAPVKEWINCRCTVAAVPVHENQAAAVDTGPVEQGVDDMDLETLIAAVDGTGLVPWHGVLAPEGVWSGDRRQFAEGALSTRDLPLPLTYQEKSGPGHDGSEVVGSIDWAEMRDGMMHAGGYMLQTPMADKAVGMMAHFGKFGVSVDADDAEFDFIEATDSEPEGVVFSKARVCSAAMVPIPAFAQAFVTMGEDPEHDYTGASEPNPADLAAQLNALSLDDDPEFRKIGTQERKDAAKDGSAMPDGSYPIKNCGDLKNAIQAIGRAKDPAKTKAHIKKRKSALGCPDVEIPDGWAEEAEEFGRGPGWITNPEDTKRIHDYWTVPGQPGYEKIAWGVPGDFERCKVEIGQEIGEEDPATVAKYMNQICSQWHHDATGFWPGHAPLEGHSLETPEGEPAKAISLVAAAATANPPHEWFEDPKFDHVTPITITDDGHIFGHVVDWTVCHMSFTGECINPGPSTNGYAYYRCGEVMTDGGPVATGPITVGTGHADRRLRLMPALAHYDNTGAAVADVAAGDDEFGIWVNGWVRPWATDQQKYELRAHPPSGDWRRNPNTGEMDMIAVLAVNAPGLPVRRVGVAAGQQVSLIASLAATEEPEAEQEDVISAIALAVVETLERRERLAALTLEED